MKRHLAILFLLAALICGAAAYTQPSSPLHKPLADAVNTTSSRLWHSFTSLPLVNLLDWHGLNDCPRQPFPADLQRNGYQHRPTAQPLQVVSPAAAGYTAADLAELYPTH